MKAELFDILASAYPHMGKAGEAAKYAAVPKVYKWVQ
jgi:hypothetical protein